MRTLLFSFAVAAMLASCTSRLYYPDRVNAPALSEAKEFKGAATVKMQTDGTFLAPGGDAAYSPLNHWGLIVSYRSMPNRWGDLYPYFDTTAHGRKNISATLHGSRFEAGSGYYRLFAHDVILEGYAGYSNGSLTASSPPVHYFDTRYHRFFAEVDAGYKDQHVAVTGGVHASMQRYYGFHSDTALYPTRDWLNPHPFVNLTDKNFWFIQPFINSEVGFRYVYYTFQAGLSGQLGPKARDISGDVFFYISFGFSVRIDSRTFRVKRPATP